MAENWDLLNEEFTDMGSWTDGDAGNGVSSIDPVGQLKLDCPTAGEGTYAMRWQDIGTIPSEYTVEFKVYLDAMGASAVADGFTLNCERASVRLNMRLATDGFFIYDGGSWNEVGTNVVDGEVWTTWRVLADDVAHTCDVYKDGVLVASDVDFSQFGAFTNGRVWLYQFGENDITQAHVDYVKIATGLIPPGRRIFLIT